MAKVLFICTVCGHGFPGTEEPDLIGTKIDRVCYTRECLSVQPHYVADSPNWNRAEVVLPPEIPKPSPYYRDVPAKKG